MVVNKNFTILILGICFLISSIVLWPGELRPDSIIQMQQGISGVFSDHHPPSMAFIWGILKHIKSGSGPMLTLHLALYWSATYLYTTATTKPNLWFLLPALLPSVICYQLFVLKDIAFVNAILFSCAWLYHYTYNAKKPSKLSLLLWALIVLYGASAKYQGIFVIPWLSFWCAKVYWPSSNWKLKGIFIYLLFLLNIESFNRITSEPSHSWQYVKMYDMAGISIQLNQDHLPECTKRKGVYTFEKIKDLYNPRRVDDMAFNADSPLQKSNLEEDRKTVWIEWFKLVCKHPILYIKHRSKIFYQQLTIPFLKKPEDIKSDTSSSVLNIVNWLYQSDIFAILQMFTAAIIYFIGQFIYTVIGFVKFKKSKAMQALFFQNMAGLSLVCSLFIFSMASEARYAYLCIALFNFSHPFFIKKQ